MFDWSNLIDLAEEFLEHQTSINEEFIYRSVINRTYYGCHGSAIQNLDLRGHAIPDDRSVHTYAINAYKQSTQPQTRKIGMLLADMHHHRKCADYDVTGMIRRQPYSRVLCEDLIKSARKVCAALAASNPVVPR